MVAWVKALADQDEERTFLCLETGFDGRTEEATREALDKGGDNFPTLMAIDDPMPLPEVLKHVRKENARFPVHMPQNVVDQDQRTQPNTKAAADAIAQSEGLSLVTLLRPTFRAQCVMDIQPRRLGGGWSALGQFRVAVSLVTVSGMR